MEKIKGIIRSVTDPREWNGQIQVGFILKGSDKWYNLHGDNVEELIETKKTLLKKGNEIEFEYDLNVVSNIEVITEAKEEEENKSDNKVVNIKGKDFVTYAGLLEKAHEKGLESIEITDSWVSEDMQKAWCKVRAKFIKDKKEMFFDGFGSSTPENTGEMTKTHPVEMAHTRAKGRALRDFLNIGIAMIEELKQSD